MTKKTASFSQHLLNQGLITSEQMEKALAIQNKDRLVGTLGLELGALTRGDLLKIKEFQEENNVKFGEAAISLKLMTSNQLKYLLDVRLRRKIRIGDILVKEGFIQKEKMYDALMEFEKYRHRLEKVLICDSSSIVNTFLKSLLERYGYQVLTTVDPLEALKIANREKPDLLIISQIFEKISGLDVSAQLLSRPDMANLNIIFIAAEVNKKLLDDAFQSGVNHYLQKPIQEYELLNIIYNIEQKEREKKKERILVVEDSALIRQTIVRELKRNGYTVLQAVNGENGLAVAKSEKPDLITLDIIMPGIDGYETCERLRNDPVTHDIPVIMITSCDSVEERMKGFESGAVEYFIKPFAVDQLANYINILFETKKVRRKEKILIIEDTRTTLHIIKHIMEKQGFNLITAENGKEGLEKIKQHKPDIILSDIYMPILDGFQVCHKVKVSLETKHTPLILLTSSGKKEDILKGLALGANDYIIKPFDEDELLARVNNLLDNKRLYEELKTANSELERKNSALGAMHKEKENFYSILTHDLRSPLTSVMGFTDLVGKEPGDNLGESSQEYLKIIKSAGERQLSTIEDALEIFRFEIGKKLETEKGDIGQVVHEIIHLQFQGIKEKGIEINLNGKPYSPEAYIPMKCFFNRLKISRVVENLLSNASKYADKKIDISYGIKEGFVEVCVRDDGKGIPGKYKDKIFQDFFQIPGSKKGTGLGLSSAKRIVEAHGGSIGVDPTPGQCAFYFTLPLNNEVKRHGKNKDNSSGR